MTAIARTALETSIDASSTWRGVAERALSWAQAEGIPIRDAVLLVPFAALLAPARAAFAAAGGWMPRIETTMTLASSLGPASAAAPGQLGFDRTVDRLSVSQLLRATAWGAQWSRSDARAFEQAVNAVVDTAHAFARAASHCAPEDRAALQQRWGVLLAPFGGPGARQRALAQLALEWASQSPVPNTDRLFAMKPSAWIVVQAGGADRLARALLDVAPAPSLLLDLDAPPSERFGLAVEAPALEVCDDLEHEAQCTAAQVLVHVARNETPVALVALDRVLVRRVRALLERQGTVLLDETGWTLSTTRAAAQLMAMLRAARPGALTDTVLDWMKSGTRWSAPSDATLARFEAECRRKQRVRVSELTPDSLDEPMSSLWADASSVLAELRGGGRLSLPAWLSRCVAALQAAGVWDALASDDAGRQVLAHLHLDRAAALPLPAGDGGGDQRAMPRWALSLGSAGSSYGEFVDWVDSVLEQATFIPTPDRTQRADAIITPLARAMLRPFEAVVCPGADARRLGAASAPHPLLSDAQLAELGLPDAGERRTAEAAAFAQLLRLPRVTLLRRRRDGDEPLADSPLVERLGLALARRGQWFQPWADPRIELPIDPAPVAPTAGAAPALLPVSLSASACEALRACPYRFFTLYVLHAREADELDEELAKRDYGNWLHAVLHAFHRERPANSSAEEDLASLHLHAETQRAAAGLDAADFEPFNASFRAFAPRYVAWQRERESEGWRWSAGEQCTRMPLAGAEPIELEGVIDRIDDGPGAVLQLIDYKTGSVSALEDKVREPLEDTQLAFYAALMRARSDRRLQAIYLALDAREGIKPIQHKEVERSASLLLDGLSTELRRLQRGEGMKPLGEAEACDYCAARGVCRRDHWSEPADTLHGSR